MVYVNPLGTEPTALQLGQNMMRNAELAEVGDVSAGSTKAKARRQAKEAAAAEATLTWSASLSEAAAREALQIYLQARNTSNTKDLLVSEFTMMRPEKTEPLIENAMLRIVAGRRYGLLGRNGIGKTTLLRHLATYAIDGMPRHLKILHVEQEVSGSDEPVLQAVLHSDLELEALREEEAALVVKLDNPEAAVRGPLPTRCRPLGLAPLCGRFRSQPPHPSGPGPGAPAGAPGGRGGPAAGHGRRGRAGPRRRHSPGSQVHARAHGHVHQEPLGRLAHARGACLRPLCRAGSPSP